MVGVCPKYELQVVNGNQILARGNSYDCVIGLSNVGITIEFDVKSDGSRNVFVCSNVWINKRSFCGSYSDEFTEREIISDILPKVCLKADLGLQKVLI